MAGAASGVMSGVTGEETRAFVPEFPAASGLGTLLVADDGDAGVGVLFAPAWLGGGGADEPAGLFVTASTFCTSVVVWATLSLGSGACMAPASAGRSWSSAC